MIILTKEMQEKGKEYVYLAEFVGGFCKIGVSKDPANRLKNVSIRNGLSLKQYVLVEGYFDLEKLLHNTFKEYRRYSEWFELKFESLVEYVSILEYKYTKKEKIKIEKPNEETKNIFMIKCQEKVFTGKEFFETLNFENNFEKKLTKELRSLENEFNTFIKNGYLFDKEKILKLIKLEKQYIFFLKQQKIKLGDESESIKEIVSIIDFCYKYMIKNY